MPQDIRESILGPFDVEGWTPWDLDPQLELMELNIIGVHNFYMAGLLLHKKVARYLIEIDHFKMYVTVCFPAVLGLSFACWYVIAAPLILLISPNEGTAVPLHAMSSSK